MSKYSVLVMSERILSYSKVIEVEAEVEEEALLLAESMAEEGEIDWGEPDTDEPGDLRVEIYKDPDEKS